MCIVCMCVRTCACIHICTFVRVCMPVHVCVHMQPMYARYNNYVCMSPALMCSSLTAVEANFFHIDLTLIPSPSSFILSSPSSSSPPPSNPFSISLVLFRHPHRVEDTWFSGEASRARPGRLREVSMEMEKEEGSEGNPYWRIIDHLLYFGSFVV